MEPHGDSPHVVIVGGGFGGLAAARALARAPVDVTLVDRTNHHLFQPLLYQVATAGLSPAEIAHPIRRILRRQRERPRPARRGGGDRSRGEARAARRRRAAVRLPDRRHRGAPLLLRERRVGARTRRASRRSRTRSRSAGARCSRSRRRSGRRTPRPVASGSPSWWSAAGRPGSRWRGPSPRSRATRSSGDFRRIDPRTARVLLVEAGPRVLPDLPRGPVREGEAPARGARRPGLDGRARHRASTRPGSRSGGDRIAARTVVWAAGVAASPLARSLGAPLDRAGPRARARPT